MNTKARALHDESIVIDGLGYSSSAKNTEAFIDDLLAAGVAAANFTVPGTDDGPLAGIKKVEEWLELIDRRSDKLMLIRTGPEIEAAKKQGKLGVIIGSQNATIIGDDIALLGVYKRLGLRILQLTYTWQNLLGEGCGERTDGGLSTFGLEVVAEMNRLGLAIDLSHCAYRVTMDAIEHSTAPVLVTHANPRALVDHGRNKTDEQIKALARKGGVIGIVTYAPLVCKGTRPTWAQFLDLLGYVVKLVGPDHVGLGTDFSLWSRDEFQEWVNVNPNLFPQGPEGGWTWRNIFVNDQGAVEYRQVFQITEGLIARGYSDDDIKKILGLNFLRVFKEVWGK